MAVVGAEVAGSWVLSPGPVTVSILLLLLSIFLTALCSKCMRHSFELQDSNADKNPSNLISVVSLEEALEVRENPSINEIMSDEVKAVSATNWNDHWGAPQNPEQNHHAVQTNGSAAATTTPGEPEPLSENDVIELIPWRSHLRAPESHDSAHICHKIEGQKSTGADCSSPPTNQQPEEDSGAHVAMATDRYQTYAQVSKKVRTTTPPVRTPEEVQEAEEVSPPLPRRETQLEG
ncbi:uncharacterized protein si:ch73-204p21.2 [Brachionichthys hirsutus]|uniref:uncharacterized protein si:ch73-204p21.2 n=1 Tax=Brachionichthys hirsutus TaxID=412623 RepID=UPI003604DFE0